ncbi:MAG: DUF4258 domain-containing protein [bacterium]|nr:DUF4258 domain-containing protein [bacterium]
MSEIDPGDLEAVLERIRMQAEREQMRVTLHAQQEMAAEDVRLDHVLEAIRCGEILENYPEHQRGACCLLGGYTKGRRPLHIVCTTAQPQLILITVYVPKLPKWVTPTKRRPKP